MCRDADATSWLMGELDFDAGGNTFPFSGISQGRGRKSHPLVGKSSYRGARLGYSRIATCWDLDGLPAVLMTGVLHAVCRREVRTALHKGW